MIQHAPAQLRELMSQSLPFHLNPHLSSYSTGFPNPRDLILSRQAEENPFNQVIVYQQDYTGKSVTCIV